MSAKPVPNEFSMPIAIVPTDIDFMGHVNNARYLEWVQDVVLSHWRELAPPHEVAGKAWVALKHEITYLKPAFLEDEILASTSLTKVAGARSFYSTTIKRGAEVLVEVESMWCCIDKQTGGAARIDRDVAEKYFGLPRKQQAYLPQDGQAKEGKK